MSRISGSGWVVRNWTIIGLVCLLAFVPVFGVLGADQDGAPASRGAASQPGATTTMDGDSSRPAAVVSKRFYFTDNDGETWFAADRSNIPPFIDKDGLTAVRCYVFRCGKRNFVGYLEKFTDKAKKKLEERKNAADEKPDPLLLNRGRLLKKKGDADWVVFDPTNAELSQKIEQIITVICPDGSQDVTPVEPGD